MDEKAIRGVPWTILTYASNKAITVAATLLLARLLVPGDFGLLALALLAVALFHTLRDLGLAGALIVRQDLDRRDQGTVLTLMLANGVVVAAVLAALSPLAADLFREPRLTGVLAALSVTVFAGGFNWFYETVMSRELEFRRRFVCLLGQSVAYASTAVVLATLDAGVWSLVAGQIAGTAVLALLLFALAPYRVRPSFDRSVAAGVIKTGSGFLAQGGLGIVQQNIDYFAVGRVLGATPLGLYSMSFRLSELPYAGIAEPVAKVTFADFARMRHGGEDISRPYLASLRLVALTACPAAILLSGAAEPFTRAVLGQQWTGMIGALAILGIWGAARPVQGTLGWLLNSIGEARLMAKISALALVPLVPGLLLAAEAGGIELVAWVMLADMVLSLALLTLYVSRRGGVGGKRQVRALAPVVVASTACWGATRSVAELLSSQPPGVALVTSVAVGIVAYLAAIKVVEPPLLAAAWSQIGRTMGHDRDPGRVADRPGGPSRS